MPRAQSGRECLAVHAPELALEPRLPSRPRFRRSLLRRLEQTRRSTGPHQIHRKPPMGQWVIITAAWYNWVEWFNNHRLFGPIGHIPPAEAEANYYAALENLDM